MSTKRTRKELIQEALSNLVSHLLYYDRRDDVSLPCGSVEDAVKKGEVSVSDLVSEFERELRGQMIVLQKPEV